MLTPTTEVKAPIRTMEDDLVEQIDVSRIQLNDEREATPEPAATSTLFPKITGRVDELIENYTYKYGTTNPIIKLTGTVKLHGTHADIVIESDNTVRIQSRNKLSVDIEHDNYSVAASLLPLKKEALKLRDQCRDRYLQLNPGNEIDDEDPVILAGEWIGPGVQKKVAIAHLPKRCFVILAVSINEEWQPDEDYANIHNEAVGIYNISRGGFYRGVLDINYPQRCTEILMTHTLEVERECPFAKSFGVSGIGEGIVWKAPYPLARDPRFWLKIKGPEHNHSHTDKLKKVEMNKNGTERAKTFAEAAVTEMRLQQAWDYLGEMDYKKDKSGIQAFNKWLVHDVEVEEKKGILDLSIDKAALKKAIGFIGRNWYFKKLGEL
jgi:RNA ligase